MKSIMHAEGALCTSDCKQQIDSSFVILFGRKHVSFFFFSFFFCGERSTFPIQMNQSISALPWGLPATEQGEDGAGKPLCLPFLTHFFPRVLSPPSVHFLPSLANTCSVSNASFCLFSLSECVSSVLLHHHPRCVLVLHL